METVTLRNYRDLNARGRGTEMYQQVAYAADGWSIWAWINEAATAVNVGPRMPPRGPSASARHCEQAVELQLAVGDLVKEIRKGEGSDIYIFGGRDEAGEEIWIEAPNQDAAAQARAREVIAAAAPAQSPRDAALAEIRRLMVEHDITAADLA